MVRPTEATWPPFVSMPPAGETVSQGAELVTVQLNAALLSLVNVKPCAAGRKGPPNGPVKVRAVAGVIRTGTGGASNAEMRLLPLGLPQREQPHFRIARSTCPRADHPGNGPHFHRPVRRTFPPGRSELHVDRKSTRLNSSHLGISYAVFC